MSDPNNEPQKWLNLILRPIVGFCVRHQIRLQDLVACAKQLFVLAARDALQKADAEVTTSRVSIMTGVHRRDVKLLVDNRAHKQPTPHIISKVIGRWMRGASYINDTGKPRPLACSGTQSEFYKLINEVNSELNPATVLFELERAGTISRQDGFAVLKMETFNAREDISLGLKILATDMEDLISAVENNLFNNNLSANLHARTEFDNIPINQLPEIKAKLKALGHDFHRKARELLAAYDRDLSTSNFDGHDRARIAVTSFSHAEENIK